MSGLWQSVSTGPVASSQWSPTVQRYLNDARTIEQGLRRTNAMTAAWPELSRSIETLNRMSQILDSNR